MQHILDSTITFSFTDIILLASAITAISIALNWISKAIARVKAPNKKQDERITAIEKRLDRHDKLFDNDSKQIKAMEEENHLSMQALLALLQHGIDGNNVDQMKSVKSEIQNYLISK